MHSKLQTVLNRLAELSAGSSLLPLERSPMPKSPVGADLFA